MQKFSIYAIIAIVFGVLGFSFARFCPFSSPKSAAASPQDTPPTDPEGPALHSRAEASS